MSHMVIHVSEAEAESDFGSVLARVRAGAEVIIESEGGGPPVAVVRPAGPPCGSLSRCIGLDKTREEGTEVSPILDSEFAADLEDIILNRKPWNPPSWD